MNMVYQDQLDRAYEMALKGATRGMVKVFLRDNGVPDEQFDLDRIMKKASMQRSREVRTKGFLMVFGGLPMFIFGVLVMLATSRMSVFSIGLMIGGLSLAGKGIVDLATGLEG